MKERKPCILIIGDAEVNTGFSRVIQSIFTRIYQKYELHQLATHYKGGTHSNKWPLYVAKTEKDPYGYAKIPELVSSLNPDIVFLIYDLVFQVEYLKILKKCTQEFKIAIYSPLESGPIHPGIGKGLKDVNAFAVYTEYAKTEMNTCINKVKVETPEFNFPEIEIIPHAVDTESFYPIAGSDKESGQMIARKALFGNDPDLLNSFIFLNANRNQPRKRIDISLESFALFAKNKPAHVRLFMHMAVKDRGWDIVLLAKRLGIEERLIMMSLDNKIPTATEEELNNIYNACDVGFTTSTGEGWGLTSFEHAATGAPQIIPSHTALKEIWTNHAAMVQPSYKLTYPSNLTHAWMVKPEDIAQAMENVYNDSIYREKIASQCYKISQRAQYSWDLIAEKWDVIFQKLLFSN